MRTNFFTISIIAAATLLTVSCNKENENEENKPAEPEKLLSPVLTVSEQTETGFTVAWEEVANAQGYEYNLNGGENTPAEACSASFTDLAPGEYTVSVRALAGDSEEFTDSDWSSVSVTLEDSKPAQNIRIEAYYNGDSYGNGLSNGWVNFIMEDGTVVCADINFKKADNPDFPVIPDGTYLPDKDGNHAEFTFNIDGDSYIFKDESNIPFTDGSMEIKANGNGYSVRCSFIYEEGTVEFDYEGRIKFINHSQEGEMSNLESDVTLDNLVQGAQILFGDLMETGETIQYAVVLAEEDYDVLMNYGPGKALVLYVSAENDATDGVPEGTYDEFIDLNTASSLPAGTSVSGAYFYGTYFGCWYFESANQDEACIKDGSFTIARDSGSGEYTVSGELLDGHGNKIKFNYTGELKVME